MLLSKLFKKDLKERQDRQNTDVDKKLMKDLLESLREHEYSRRNIKKLLYRYYKFYPENFVEGMSWLKQVLSKEDIRVFLDRGILIKDDDDDELIKLGPSGLNLISMWNTEHLTKILIIITGSSLLIATLSLVLSLAKT